MYGRKTGFKFKARKYFIHCINYLNILYKLFTNQFSVNFLTWWNFLSATAAPPTHYLVD